MINFPEFSRQKTTYRSVWGTLRTTNSETNPIYEGCNRQERASLTEMNSQFLAMRDTFIKKVDI